MVSFNCRKHHFAEALESADIDFGVGVEFFFQQFVAMFLVARINGFCAMRETIERRHREEQMTFMDEARHLPVKESNQQ